VVPLILQAIGHIAFVLSGTNDDQETTSILTNFFCQEDNRISYQNTLVMEQDGVVVGMTILYDGCKARQLDVPIERAAAKKSGDSNYHIPTEPETSGFYLDTLSVSPPCQSKGYGSKFIEAGCDRGRKLGHKRIALLVEIDAAVPVVRAMRVSCRIHQVGSGTGIFPHGKDVVMHQGDAVLQGLHRVRSSAYQSCQTAEWRCAKKGKKAQADYDNFLLGCDFSSL
jgi:GNAT superfamily N-acetyltransferase